MEFLKELLENIRTEAIKKSLRKSTEGDLKKYMKPRKISKIWVEFINFPAVMWCVGSLQEEFKNN